MKSFPSSPPSARPIAPALAPDGKWVAYVGLAQGEPQVFVQFLNGGAPINLTKGSEVPVLNRSLVGGIDIAPDGNAIGFASPFRATGLWSIPGVWMFPAPMGGPPRRVTDRFASIRWSPDGRLLAAVVANPLAGDAVVVSDTDGQNERVIVRPAEASTCTRSPGHRTAATSATRRRSSRTTP